MKIAVVGSNRVDVEKFVDQFSQNWPQYNIVETRRDIDMSYFSLNAGERLIKNADNALVSAKEHKDSAHVLLVDTAIDAFISGSWAYKNANSNKQQDNFWVINEHDLDTLIDKAREYLEYVDVVFVLRFDEEQFKKNIENDDETGISVSNQLFANGVVDVAMAHDKILTAWVKQYTHEFEGNGLFPESCAGIIECPAGEYLSTVKSIVNPSGNLWNEDAVEDSNPFVGIGNTSKYPTNLRQMAQNLLAANQVLAAEKEKPLYDKVNSSIEQFEVR